MWYCNGDMDNDCCMTFEEPDVSVDRRGRVTFTCPYCGAWASPSDAAGRAMEREIREEVGNR